MCGGMGAPPLSRLRPLRGSYKYEMSRCVPGVPRPLRGLLPLTWRNPIRILYEHRTNPAPIGERDRVSGQILVARGKEAVGLAAPRKGAFIISARLRRCRIKVQPRCGCGDSFAHPLPHTSTPGGVFVWGYRDSGTLCHSAPNGAVPLR